MKNSTPKHRKVLFLGREMGMLNPVAQQLRVDCPQIQVYLASTHYDGLQLLLSLSFDLFIPELGTRPGTDLIELALKRQVPVLVILNGREPPGFRESLGSWKVRALSCQQDIQEVVRQIEKVLALQCLSRWRRLLGAMGKFPAWAIYKMSPGKPGNTWCN
ncbi:MAG: hypothetical protein JRJ29_01745 [Deltaproteobacteria bacterium]|nr:hypothetical protein [Deltaproteobacteria bacterium]